MDMYSAGLTVSGELHRRHSQFNGGNSNNTVGYITHKSVGNKIVMDIGMNLVSRSYVPTIERQIRSVLDSIVRECGIPYTVTYSLGYCIN